MLTFHPVSARDPGDVAAVQRLLESAPAYLELVEGRAPRAGDALEAVTDLPPGKAPADKVFGLYREDGEVVGCLDIVRGYPERPVAFVGLLLFADAHQGRGLGRQALAHIREVARGWHCTTLRLAVIANNTRALAFWRREGFREIHRKAVPRFTAEAIVMEAPVAAPP